MPMRLQKTTFILNVFISAVRFLNPLELPENRNGVQKCNTGKNGYSGELRSSTFAIFYIFIDQTLN